MNKSYVVLGVAVVLTSFISGLVGALFVVNIFSDKAWEKFDEERHLASDLLKQHYPEELMLSLGMGNIEAIREKNYEALYRSNCFLIRSQLFRVHPEEIKGEDRRKELVERVAKAKELLKALEDEGLCITNQPSPTR